MSAAFEVVVKGEVEEEEGEGSTKGAVRRMRFTWYCRRGVCLSRAVSIIRVEGG